MPIHKTEQAEPERNVYVETKEQRALVALALQNLIDQFSDPSSADRAHDAAAADRQVDVATQILTDINKTMVALGEPAANQSDDPADVNAFDPTGGFSSPNDALRQIYQQTVPIKALLALVEAQVGLDECGFASEVVRDFNSSAEWVKAGRAIEESESLLILPNIGSRVTVKADGKLLSGVVTGHDSKDGKPIFDYQHDHVMPDGSVVKADKWAWLEQLLDMTF